MYSLILLVSLFVSSISQSPQRILLFGHSSTGKSTFAQHMAKTKKNWVHIEKDVVADHILKKFLKKYFPKEYQTLLTCFSQQDIVDFLRNRRPFPKKSLFLKECVDSLRSVKNNYPKKVSLGEEYKNCFVYMSMHPKFEHTLKNSMYDTVFSVREMDKHRPVLSDQQVPTTVVFYRPISLLEPLVTQRNASCWGPQYRPPTQVLMQFSRFHKKKTQAEESVLHQLHTKDLEAFFQNYIGAQQVLLRQRNKNRLSTKEITKMRQTFYNNLHIDPTQPEDVLLTTKLKPHHYDYIVNTANPLEVLMLSILLQSGLLQSPFHALILQLNHLFYTEK